MSPLLKIGPIRRLRHRVGRRGAFLLFLWLLDWVYAYGLAFPTPRALSNPTSIFLMHIMPLGHWAFAWGAVGTVCLFYAFRSIDAPAYAAATLLKVTWATTFLLGWIFAGVERGYLSTAIFGAFAAVIMLISTWPDDPGEPVLKSDLPDVQ